MPLFSSVSFNPMSFKQNLSKLKFLKCHLLHGTISLVFSFCDCGNIPDDEMFCDVDKLHWSMQKFHGVKLSVASKNTVR